MAFRVAQPDLTVDVAPYQETVNTDVGGVTEGASHISSSRFDIIHLEPELTTGEAGHECIPSHRLR